MLATRTMTSETYFEERKEENQTPKQLGNTRAFYNALINSRTRT